MYTRCGGFLRGRRPVRPAVLRHLAARSGEHGPPAAPAAGGELGGARARRASPRRAARAADTGVFVGISTQRLLAQLVQGQRRRPHRPLLRHGRRLLRGLGPALLPARPPGAEPGGRHGVLVVAGGRPPRRARACGAGECRMALAGGRQPHAGSRRPRSIFPRCARSPPTGRARPSTRARTGTCAARAAAWWC